MGMGMKMGGASASWASQSQGVSNTRKNQQGMKTLLQDLKSGDLKGAQQAYAALTANKPAPSSSSPLGQIGAALQNNDLAAAQKVVDQMRSQRSAQTNQTAAAVNTLSSPSSHSSSSSQVDVWA